MTNYALPVANDFPRRRFKTAASGNPASLLLDAASEHAWQVFRIPVTGDIVGVNWRTGTVTTGSTMDVQLQTVDATTGLPTGTLYHANATGTSIIANTDDNLHITDGYGGGTAWGTVPVTAGDIVALVIGQPASSPGSLNLGIWANEETVNFPYYGNNTSGSEGKAVSSHVMFSLEYSGGIYYPVEGGFINPGLRSAYTWNNASANKEIGAKIVLPFDGRSSGVGLVMDSDSKSDVIISIYDSGGTLLASTPTIDTNQFFAYSGANGDIYSEWPWTTPVDLSGGSTYYVGVKPQAGTSIDLGYGTPPSGAMGAMPGGGSVTKVERATQGSGAWTETTTEEPIISLLFDQLARAGGGAAGMQYRNNMQGNIG